MRYDLAQFGATHNSYSGGRRGSLEGQLVAGIRCVELDFHDNGYREYRDYRVGHVSPECEVAVGGGNPSGFLLRDWLSVIAAWSADHAGHGPITLVLDCKDDLTDNDDEGDLEDLNQTLESVFPLRLFSPGELGSGEWPDVEALKDRVLCVLSGHGGTRLFYRWTRGSSPAISVNANGAVVLVYQAAAKDLRCWTGRIDPFGGRIQWQRRGTYRWNAAPLSHPAVAMNDEGWVVAVHEVRPTPDFPSAVVESVVGRQQVDGRIAWFGTKRYALGRQPTVRMLGDDVRSIHLSPDGGEVRLCLGKLDRQAKTVEWGPSVDSDLPQFQKSSSRLQSKEVSCVAEAGLIRATFDVGPSELVRFRQLAFVERQKGNDDSLFAEARFFAADAKNKTDIQAAGLAGKVTRAWNFEPGDQTQPPANMPATNDHTGLDYAAYLKLPQVTV
jgi:hypothetical protein